MKHNSNVGNHNFLKKTWIYIKFYVYSYSMAERIFHRPTHCFYYYLFEFFVLLLTSKVLKLLSNFSFLEIISSWKNECGNSQLRFLLACLNLVLLILLTSLEALVVLSVAFWPDCVLSLLLFWVRPFGRTVCCCWW